MSPLVVITHPRLAASTPLLEAQGWRVVQMAGLEEGARPEVRALLHLGEMELSPAWLGGLPGLGLIACIGAGYDGVDVDWCREREIAVSRAVGLNAEDVAEHAMALVLAAWRDVVGLDRFVREGEWREGVHAAPGRRLAGRRMGIVGMGAIGEAVARRAVAFGLEVAWWGPRAKESVWRRVESLVGLARESDILVVACRAERANRGMVGVEVIEAVGREGLLVNVSRGSVVDEDGLRAALTSGALGAAALDVFWEEPSPAGLWAGVPHVVLTPHVGGATREAVGRMVGQALENIRRHLAGEGLLSPVEH